MFRSIWNPEDHPLLVDVEGDLALNRTPTGWDHASGRVESPRMAESRARRGVRRIDDVARHYLLELAFVRNPRRGPIRSHQSGRRGWRQRTWTIPDPVEQERHDRALKGLETLIRTGHGYSAATYSHFEQRPCLIEQVGLERISWCTRPDCPGCRGNYEHDHLFAGSEAWTTTRGPEGPQALRQNYEATTLHEKPAGRVTVRVSHPAGDQAAATAAAEAWRHQVDGKHRKLLATWVAPDGCSWRGPGERTAVVQQPADLEGPEGWTRLR